MDIDTKPIIKLENKLSTSLDELIKSKKRPSAKPAKKQMKKTNIKGKNLSKNETIRVTIKNEHAKKIRKVSSNTANRPTGHVKDFQAAYAKKHAAGKGSSKIILP